MRNVDTNKLSSLYESRIVKKEVLTEAQPPFAELEGWGSTPEEKKAKYSAMSPSEEKHPATMSPKYGEGAANRQVRLSPEQVKKAVYNVGTKVLEKLKEYPDGVFPGDRNEFFKIVAEIIREVLKTADGQPLYPMSHAYHVARQFVNELEEQKVIEYWRDTVKRPRAKKEITPDVVAAMEDPFGGENEAKGGMPKLDVE